MFFSFIKDKKTLKQGLQVRCRELDIFNQFFLEIVWKFFGFLGEFFRRIFWEEIFCWNFGKNFWEDFFGSIVLGGFFGRIFMEGILWEELLSRYYQRIDIFVKILG